MRIDANRNYTLSRFLTVDGRNLRMTVRNFLLVATKEELQRELENSIGRDDFLRAAFILELISEQP